MPPRSMSALEKNPQVPAPTPHKVLGSVIDGRGIPGDLRDPLCWPQERSVPSELVGGISGFLSCRCRGLRPCVESVPEPENSSPVLTWILGTSESPQGSQSSSRVRACTCVFLSSRSSSVTLPFAWIKGSVAYPRCFPASLSHEGFPQGCPTCHRGVSRSSS